MVAFVTGSYLRALFLVEHHISGQTFKCLGLHKHGKECRAVHCAGRLQLGRPRPERHRAADAGDYLNDDGEYAKLILDGDIHTANQKAAGLETRDQAKTFIYALCYGAGPSRIGEIVGKGAKEGALLRKRFFATMPAFEDYKRAARKLLHVAT